MATVVMQALPLCLLGQSNITTIAGTGVAGFSGDSGLAVACKFHNPVSLAFDKSGNLYISDVSNNRVRKINNLGIVSTIAGTGSGGFSGDNGLATSAQLNMPYGIAIDKNDNLFISDFGNYRLRKITASGVITTVAGTASSAYNGDGIVATTANLDYPAWVGCDTLGSIFISEQNDCRIRKIDISDTINTVCGTGTCGYNGEGISGTLAQISNPSGLAFDQQGNLVFGDGSNNRLRLINSSGVISLVAGNGGAGYTGDNGIAINAQLSQPVGIVVDGIGNIFFSDQNNHVVRKIDTNGIITTVVGTGSPGYNGDNISATSAQLYYPEGIVLDSLGNLYIADNYNNRVRKVTNVGIMNAGANKPQTLNMRLSPNPSDGEFVLSYFLSQDELFVLYDVTGIEVSRYTLSASQTSTKISETNLSSGVYIYRLIGDSSVVKTGKLMILKR